MKIGLISMMVELDSQPCVVALPQEKLRLLLKMAEGLTDNGKLPVKKLGSDYRIEVIGKE